MTTFINESVHEFTDISTEEYRSYTFPGGDTVTIKNPLKLAVSAGGHRVFDGQGMSHYIPKGWIHLKWKAKEGMPNIVK